MSAGPAMMYNTSMSPFSNFSEPWNEDCASIQPRRYNQWGETAARRSPNMSSRSNLQQPYLSDLRTTISPVESPAYQSLMLPHESTIMPPMHMSNAHVPRGLEFMHSSSSTDSDDCSEPTASSQWQNYNFPYTGRSSSPFQASRSSTSSPDWSGGLNLQIPALNETQNWGPMLLSDTSAVTPYTPHQMPLNGFVFPHRISPLPSPSPPPLYQDLLPPAPSSKAPAAAAASTSRGARDSTNSNGVKKCSHCQATSTPLWRRDPSTFKPLCNACGLYLQQRNRLRPQELIDADIDDDTTSDDSNNENYVGPECSHCRTHNTSVWRRSKTGAQLCNACGVYQRLRGKPRPLSLKRNKIKPRSKHPKP